MAADLGQTVGKPWDISEEGGWSAYQYSANSLNTPGMTARDADQSTIAPGQLTIRASVKVSFQLE